jgi:hypothetical protein
MPSRGDHVKECSGNRLERTLSVTIARSVVGSARGKAELLLANPTMGETTGVSLRKCSLRVDQHRRSS